MLVNFYKMSIQSRKLKKKINTEEKKLVVDVSKSFIKILQLFIEQ